MDKIKNPESSTSGALRVQKRDFVHLNHLVAIATAINHLYQISGSSSLAIVQGIGHEIIIAFN